MTLSQIFMKNVTNCVSVIVQLIQRQFWSHLMVSVHRLLQLFSDLTQSTDIFYLIIFKIFTSLSRSFKSFDDNIQYGVPFL
jgi:hypothetical protein